MARGKKGRKSAATAPASAEPRRAESRETPPRGERRFTLLDYVVVCVFFIAFCYLQKFVALKVLHGSEVEKLSLNFFFDTMWKGFVIVAFLVWLHDYFYRDVEEENTT